MGHRTGPETRRKRHKGGFGPDVRVPRTPGNQPDSRDLSHVKSQRLSKRQYIVLVLIDLLSVAVLILHASGTGPWRCRAACLDKLCWPGPCSGPRRVVASFASVCRCCCVASLRRCVVVAALRRCVVGAKTTRQGYLGVVFYVVLWSGPFKSIGLAAFLEGEPRPNACFWCRK